MVKNDDLHSLRADLQKKLGELVRQRDRLNARIVQTTSRLKNLPTAIAIDETTARTIHEKGMSGIGLTEAVRFILRSLAAHSVQTPGVVLGVLRSIGFFDFSHYSNPAAAVHTTLKRLVASGEVIYVPSKKGYRYRKGLF